MTKVIFPRGKYWKCLYVWNYLLREGFTFYSSFYILLILNVTKKPHGSRRFYKQKPILDHLRSVCTPECEVSVDESLMMWKGRYYKVHFIIKHIYDITNLMRTGPTAIYIHTEGMGKILMNIFETSYCR
jgi:hypothetical protein